MIGDQQGAYTRLKCLVVGLDVDADDDANCGSDMATSACFFKAGGRLGILPFK